VEGNWNRPSTNFGLNVALRNKLHHTYPSPNILQLSCFTKWTLFITKWIQPLITI